MTAPRYTLERRASLVEAVDHLLNRGAVLAGQATVSLADVPLIYLGLNLVVSSVETLREADVERGREGTKARQSEGERGREGATERQGEGEGGVQARLPFSPSLPLSPSPSASPSAPPPLAPGAEERPEQGLARLVLTLIELLRQVLERQALRRVEGGGLSDEQVERMGVALMQLEARMAELRETFELADEDVNLDLGPLGRML